MTDLMIVGIKDGDLVRLLQDLDCTTRKNKRHTSGPTLVARAGKTHAGQRHFAELLHDLRRPRLQDRIGVIAYKLNEIAHAVFRWRLPGARPVDGKIPEQLCDGTPRPVDQRSGTRRQRLKAGDGAVDPHASEIRDGCGAFLAAIGW